MNSTLMNTLDADRRRALENVREAAARLWSRPLHRYYTDHTVAHSERIVALLDGLTAGMMGTDKRLSPTEVFILVAAAYLHDIGMQNEKFAGGDPSTGSGQGLDEIRAHHNEQTAEMIYAVFEDPARAFPIPLAHDPGLVETVALVAKGHRRVDLNAAEYEPFVHGGETLRLRLLAALLRFGDELDIDHRRVDLEQMKLLALPVESQLRWWKCHYVSGVSIADEYIRVSYRFPQDRPDYEGLIVPLVEGEVRAKNALLEEVFRANMVKVALGPPQVRLMRLVQPLPPEVEALARQGVEKMDDGAAPQPLPSVASVRIPQDVLGLTVADVELWSYPAGSGVAGVAVSADGSRILAGTLDKQVLCLDRDGRVLWSAKVGNQAWRVGLSADGQVAVAGTGSTRPWDMKGRGLYAFDGDGQLRWQQDLGASAWGLALAADGRTVAVGTDGHEALLFDSEGHLLWRRKTPGLRWWAWVMATALSADGQTVAVGSTNKTVLILDRGGNLLGEHRAAADVYAVTVSADGQTVAAGSIDQWLYLLGRKGDLLWCEKLEDKVWAVALSADGQRLVVGASEKEAHIRTFDRGGRSLWKRYVEGSVSSVAVSAGAEIFMAGTRAGHAYLFDGDGEPLHHHVAQKIIRDVAVSANGRVAASVSEDGQVYGFLLSPRPVTLLPEGGEHHPVASVSSQPKEMAQAGTFAPEDERAALRGELARHKRNLYKLREQAAIYVAGETPLHLLNQIEAEEEKIRRIETELDDLGDLRRNQK